jgi:hypothetical protein
VVGRQRGSELHDRPPYCDMHHCRRYAAAEAIPVLPTTVPASIRLDRPSVLVSLRTLEYRRDLLLQRPACISQTHHLGIGQKVPFPEAPPL